MPATQEARTRIVAAKKKRQEFIERNPRNERVIEGVFCPICGTRTMGWVEHEQLKGKMIMMALPAYQEIVMEFDDDSAHVVALCRNCAKTLKPEDLETIYALDMADMEKAEMAGDGPVPWHVFEKRKPVGFKVN